MIGQMLLSVGAGVYVSSTIPALGKGGFGTVRKGYIPSASAGLMQPCAVKQVLLKNKLHGK